MRAWMAAWEQAKRAANARHQEKIDEGVNKCAGESIVEGMSDCVTKKRAGAQYWDNYQDCAGQTTKDRENADTIVNQA